HYPDGWVYARTFSDVDLSTTGATVWKRTFHLDEIGGDAAHRYQFVPIASRGDIAVTYTIDGRVVSISVAPVWIAPGYSEVGFPGARGGALRRARAGTAGLQLGRARLHLPGVVRRHGLSSHGAGGEMTEQIDVVLVYPQRAPKQGRHWIMPSLGLMYLSASLRQAGYTVRHIDHTFLA